MRASGLFLLQCLLWVFGAAPSHADAPVPETAAAAASTVLTLDGLLARVDDPGGPLEAARGELAAYQALYDRAYWSWLPTLKLESLMAPLPERRLLEECAFTDPTLDPGLLRVGPCPGARPADDERIDADTDIGILTRSRATLTLPLYTFGKFSAGRRAAEGGLEVGRATLEATQAQVSLMVKRAWYGAQMTASALEILEDGRKRLQTAKRQIEKELADETGRFTTNDLRKLLVKEAELEAGYLETRALSDYAWEGLRLAAGAPEGARLELAEKALAEVQVVERDVDGWMNLAGSHRADVRLVDAGFRARQGQVDLATAEFFPDIALVAAFGYAKGTSAMDNPDPFANDQYNFLSWGFVVGAEWKLDFAARMGKLREAEANLSKLRGQRDALRQKMRLEIVEELGTVRRYTAELESRRQAMKAGKGWLVSNTMNFGIGLATTDELLDSLVAYSSARLSYFRTLFELNIAVARLQNAVGVAVVVPPPKTNP
jgi:outer membrane protein TolC